VPGKPRILPVAISCLLTIPAAQAAKPVWECRTSADGSGWECFKDGVLVEPEPIPARPPLPKVTKPAEQPAPPATEEPAKEEIAAEPAPPKKARPTPEPEPPKAAPQPEPAVATTEAEPDVPEAAPTTTAPVSLARIDRGLNWDRCGPLAPQQPTTDQPAKPDPLDERTYITADAAEVQEN
jgi:hypothetical protein